MDKKTISALKKISKKALAIQSRLHLGTRILTPTNLLPEREKFFNSKTYSPQFSYLPVKSEITDEEIDDLIKELSYLSLQNDLNDYFWEFFHKLKLQRKMFNAIGTPQFASFSSQLFSIKEAEIDQYLQMIPQFSLASEGIDLQTAVSIKHQFESVLYDKYALNNITVFLDDFNPFTVRVGGRKIVIGSGVKRYQSNVERLIVHEIESHVIRRHNLLCLSNPLHRLASLDQTILFSEGLAVFNEIESRTITQSALNIYIQRMQSVDRIEDSFRKIYSYLLNFLSPKLAFMMTYRVKRGLSDTSLPGGFKKDAYYLMGYFRVKEFVDNGGTLAQLYTFATPELFNLLKNHNLHSEKKIILPHFLSHPRVDYKELLNN